jgi:hypothetical protein
MKTIVVFLSFIVVIMMNSCSSCSESGKRSKISKIQIDSLKKYQTPETIPVNKGGKQVTINDLKVMADGTVIYFQDPFTKLCYAAVSSETSANYYALSITQVASQYLKEVNVYILKRE